MKEKIVKKIHGVPPYCYLEIFQIEGGGILKGGGAYNMNYPDVALFAFRNLYGNFRDTILQGFHF